MIKVNPRVNTIGTELIEAYLEVAAATLGHALESGMGPEIRPVWRPVKLLGTALTIQTTPDVTSAVLEALEVAQAGDVVVVNRAGNLRHAFTGEFGSRMFIERGVVGLVTDGLIADVAALEQLKFPVFCAGVSATLMQPLGMGREPEGAVNVPVQVGGVVVSPGDLILADDDGVIVASPEQAREHLPFCQEKEAWDDYARSQIAAGHALSEVTKERELFRQRFTSAP